MGNLVKIHDKLSLSADLIDKLSVHVGPWTEEELKQANYICLDGTLEDLKNLGEDRKVICIGLGMFHDDTVYLFNPVSYWNAEQDLAELRELINQARSRR